MFDVIRSYKRIALILMGFVIIGAVGLRLDVHYCKGNLAGISLILPDMPCCAEDAKAGTCCAEEESDQPCCEDKEQMAVLDFEAPLNQIQEFSDIDFENYNVDFSSLQIEQNFALTSDLSGVGPPIYQSSSGMEIRIRLQSFIC